MSVGTVLTSNVSGGGVGPEAVGGAAKMIDPRIRVSASAPARPRLRPIVTSISPSRMTIASTPVRAAPSAIRMPNSCVRWLTENAITPAIPAAVMTRARRPNMPISATTTRRGARPWDRTSASVLNSCTGRSESWARDTSLICLTASPIGSFEWMTHDML